MFAFTDSNRIIRALQRTGRIAYALIAMVVVTDLGIEIYSDLWAIVRESGTSSLRGTGQRELRLGPVKRLRRHSSPLRVNPAVGPAWA